MDALRRRLLVCSIVLLGSVLPLPLAFARVAAQPAPGEGEVEYTGSIRLVYELPANPAFNAIRTKIEKSKVFEDTVGELNDTLSLPSDLRVTFSQCGEVNAFYDSETKRVIMCYELVAAFEQQFADNYPDKASAEVAVIDATLFVFHHELGHALVHLLELPITGKEEDAVDDLATLVLLHHWEDGDEAALNAAEAFYISGDQEESELADLAYWDEHSLDKQRYYSITCIVYGSDTEAHKELVGEDLPEERAERCPEEYQQKSTSWNTLLGDYWDQGPAAGDPAK